MLALQMQQGLSIADQSVRSAPLEHQVEDAVSQNYCSLLVLKCPPLTIEDSGS
jgi:hypothetical protein